MLIALTFFVGDRGDLISRLHNKVVLLDQRAHRPTTFGADALWVCEVTERERFAIARPLRLASEWPRVPAEGGGPFISSSTRLPGGRLRPEPPVQGLGEINDPRAAEVAARLNQDGRWSRGYYTPFDRWGALVAEFGEPTISIYVCPYDGEKSLIATWATPWGPLAIRDGFHPCARFPWVWTGVFREEVRRNYDRPPVLCLMGEQALGEHRQWVFAARKGSAPVEGAPEAARTWCDSHLPDPTTCDLFAGRAPELLARLQKMYDDGLAVFARVWTFSEDGDSEDFHGGPPDSGGYTVAIADFGPPGRDVRVSATDPYRLRGAGVGFAAARYKGEPRDEVLCALLIGHALGDGTALAMSDRSIAILMARALAILPPRLDRREDHPRWGEIPALTQQRDEALAAWREADRQIARLIRSRPDVQIERPPEAPSYSTSRVAGPAPWLALEGDIAEARRGAEAARAVLAGWPEALAAAEAVERASHGAPTSAAWHLHGITEAEALDAAPELQVGIGISTALHATRKVPVPGPCHLVWIRKHYGGGKRHGLEVPDEEMRGVVVLWHRGGRRERWGLDLLCAVTSPDWRVVVRHTHDGEFASDCVYGPGGVEQSYAGAVLVAEPEPTVAMEPSSPATLADLRAKWGAR